MTDQHDPISQSEAEKKNELRLKLLKDEIAFSCPSCLSQP